MSPEIAVTVCDAVCLKGRCCSHRHPVSTVASPGHRDGVFCRIQRRGHTIVSGTFLAAIDTVTETAVGPVYVVESVFRCVADYSSRIASRRPQ